MARNTRIFSDLDLSFLPNPGAPNVNGVLGKYDVAKKYDENAIKQSIRSLIMTNHYERLFHPEIGSQVTALLFEPASPMLDAMMTRAIINTIENHEPRVQVLDVKVSMNPDNNTVYVSVEFNIVNTAKPITVKYTLQRTR